MVMFAFLQKNKLSFWTAVQNYLILMQGHANLEITLLNKAVTNVYLIYYLRSNIVS